MAMHLRGESTGACDCVYALRGKRKEMLPGMKLVKGHQSNKEGNTSKKKSKYIGQKVYKKQNKTKQRTFYKLQS